MASVGLGILHNHPIADSNGVSDVNQHIPDIPTRSGAFDIRNS